GDDRAGGHLPPGVGAVDDHGPVEQVLELTDARLHLPLVVLGRVVVAVLAQVAHLPGPLDEAGDLGATAGGEVVELGLQPLVGILGQVRLGHDARLVGGCRYVGLHWGSCDHAHDHRNSVAHAVPGVCLSTVHPGGRFFIARDDTILVVVSRAQ